MEEKQTNYEVRMDGRYIGVIAESEIIEAFMGMGRNGQGVVATPTEAEPTMDADGFLSKWRCAKIRERLAQLLD